MTVQTTSTKYTTASLTCFFARKINQLGSPNIAMNTAAEFFEWMIGAEMEPCRVDMEEDGSNPSLLPCSDSEMSSLEDSSLCSSDCGSSATLMKGLPRRRRVSFTKVEVREYAVTVGDHPFCFDGLPITLDWEHTDEPILKDIEDSRERCTSYKAPKRLSFDERRDRLFTVSAHSHESERNMELNMMIKMLQNSWSMNHILPPPKLHDIDEEEEDEDLIRRHNAKAKPQKAQEFKWKRNFHRSQSFSE